MTAPSATAIRWLLKNSTRPAVRESGNLLPGESGEIVLTFAAALNVADYSARFSLPLRTARAMAAAARCAGHAAA